MSRACLCGAVLRATIAAEGEATRKPVRWTGEGASLVFLDDAATAAEAVTNAEADAHAHGRELLELFPCPLCGLRPGRAAVRRRMLVAALPPAALERQT